MEGWIKFHRKIKNHWLYNERREFSKFEAWTDILLEVNHSKNKILIGDSLMTVNPGESLNSLDTWAKRWNWNKSKVRRVLKLFQNENMIELKNERKTTRLTVCKYERYQVERNANDTQTKRKRHANDTQMTPNKNEKNEKNEKNVKEREENFAKQVRSLNFDLPETEIKKFIIHWTEKNPKGRKLRFEKEKTFDLKRRLMKWKANYEQWNSKQTKKDKLRHSNDSYSPECKKRLTGAAKKLYELYSGDVKKVNEAKELKEKIWAALTTTDPNVEATKSVYVKVNKYYEAKRHSSEKLKGIDNFLNEI